MCEYWFMLDLPEINAGLSDGQVDGAIEPFMHGNNVFRLNYCWPT